MSDNSIQTTQEYLTLSQVATILPRLNGRKVHVATIWRWCRKGLRGKYLEYSRIGRTMVICEAKLYRFFMELAAADHAGQASSPVTRKRRPQRTIGAARQRAIEDANQVLLRAGILTADDQQFASVQDGRLR